ncbi:MAG: hypothetical protein GC171_12955 [Terrimonas sp.]|nr:hypothetical protein [Terrimonas sp.]
MIKKRKPIFRFFLMILLLLYTLIQCPAQEIIFRKPTPYTLSFIGNDSIRFSSINYKLFRVYFKDSSFTAAHLPSIKQSLDLAMDRILSVLQVASYTNGIQLIAVDSKEEMQSLMGYKIKGGAAKGEDLVFFVYNASIRPQFKHEIFHLIAYETWGNTPSHLLDEVGATFTDDFCFYDNPMYSINAYYLREKLLFPFDSLINHFNDMAKKNDVIAYIQSAGIFKYLYEKYGAAKMKLLWKEGFESFPSIYGYPVELLETEWLHFIQTVPIPENFDIRLLKEGCG